MIERVNGMLLLLWILYYYECIIDWYDECISIKDCNHNKLVTLNGISSI